MLSLKGKRIVFLGQLKRIKRTDAVARLELAGGVQQDRVNSKTNYLVLPEDESEALCASRLYRDAAALQAVGLLRIIREPEFLELLQGC